METRTDQELCRWARDGKCGSPEDVGRCAFQLLGTETKYCQHYASPVGTVERVTRTLMGEGKDAALRKKILEILEEVKYAEGDHLTCCPSDFAEHDWYNLLAELLNHPVVPGGILLNVSLSDGDEEVTGDFMIGLGKYHLSVLYDFGVYDIQTLDDLTKVMRGLINKCNTLALQAEEIRDHVPALDFRDKEKEPKNE